MPQQYQSCLLPCSKQGDPELTVRLEVAPASDPGRFNLRIDDVIRQTNAGDGSSVSQLVNVGRHVVSQTAGTNSDLANYAPVIGGACAADGSVLIAGGEHKTCTITNTGPRLTVRAIVEPPGDQASSICGLTALRDGPTR